MVTLVIPNIYVHCRPNLEQFHQKCIRHNYAAGISLSRKNNWVYVVKCKYAMKFMNTDRSEVSTLFNRHDTENLSAPKRGETTSQIPSFKMNTFMGHTPATCVLNPPSPLCTLFRHLSHQTNCFCPGITYTVRNEKLDVFKSEIEGICSSEIPRNSYHNTEREIFPYVFGLIKL